MKNRLTLICIVALVGSQLYAGAWNRRPGSFYLKFSSSYLSTSKEFNYLGRENRIYFPLKETYPDASFIDRYSSAYVEYGLLPKLTLVSQVAFNSMQAKRVEVSGGGSICTNIESSTIGFSDLDVGLRYGLHESRLVFASESTLKIPLNYENDPSVDAPPLGTGEVDFTQKLLVARGFNPGYFNAGFGYRFRGGERFNDQIVWDAETGLTLGNTFLKLYVEGIQSTQSPPDIYGSPRQSSVGGALPTTLTGDQDIFKISPSLTYYLSSETGISFDIIHVFAGKNTISGTSFALGLVWERK